MAILDKGSTRSIKLTKDHVELTIRLPLNMEEIHFQCGAAAGEICKLIEANERVAAQSAEARKAKR